MAALLSYSIAQRDSANITQLHSAIPHTRCPGWHLRSNYHYRLILRISLRYVYTLALNLQIGIAMLIAVPIWEGRVSPVFDVAQRLALTTIDSGKAVRIQEVAIPSEDPPARVKLLVEQKVDVLLCGAVSGCVRTLLEESGIRVVPYVCGPVEAVLDAFLENRLADSGLVMPGCACGRGNGGRQRRRRDWGRNQQEPERPAS